MQKGEWRFRAPDGRGGEVEYVTDRYDLARFAARLQTAMNSRGMVPASDMREVFAGPQRTVSLRRALEMLGLSRECEDPRPRLRLTANRFAVRLVHLNPGWRYWAFHVRTGGDEEYGLEPDGYGTEAEAWAAVEEAEWRAR